MIRIFFAALLCVFFLTLPTGAFSPARPVFAQLPTSTPTPRSVRSTVYLPVISSKGAQFSPGQQGAQQGGAVYGLVGRLSKATGQPFNNYLLTNDKVTYGLVGSTAAIEQHIAELRDRQPAILVQVWGNIYTGAANTPVIVATDLLAGDLAPTPTPAVLPPSAQPTIRVNFSLVNLYAGPSTAYAITGQVSLSQVCDITGRNSTSMWWEIRCANNLLGWIDGRLVTTSGSLSSVPIAGQVAIPTPTAIATPTPIPSTPTPLPIPSNTWRATYFNNTQLAGNPVNIADIAVLNLNWGTSKPDVAITADAFSARFERTIYFNPGFYRFTASADDGIRVWLDGGLLFDEWHGASGQIYTIGRTLSGTHTLRVEYYEAGGVASLRFIYALLNDPPAWTTSYFGGVNLTGASLLSQQEPRSTFALDYNWGSTSPMLSVVPADNWSARWVGQFTFEGSNYIFRANADDGVRVYIDDLLVVDHWSDGYHEDSNRFLGVGEGTHTIRIEYYERTGSARLRVWWYREFGNQPVPQ